MSVCGHPDEESVCEEPVPALPTHERDIRTKSASKVVRVMTVLAYLLSVSLAAIVLSVYYVCMWNSTMEAANGTELAVAAAQRDHPYHRHHTGFAEYQHYRHNAEETVEPVYRFKGGSSTSIGDSSTESMSSSDAYSDTTEPSSEHEPSAANSTTDAPIT